MTTLPNSGIVLPTRGAPGSGLWADALDAALSLVDAHDHTSGKGVAIPSAGININADLTFGGSWAPVHLNRITFDSVTALSSNNKSLFVNTSDNELYWRSNAGSNVKLTSGAALNVAAFTGGIGGDYASVGAAVAFDDAGDRYTFKQNSGTGWARLASGDVRLFETGTSETVFVGLAAPGALAASYTVTMPLAAPGSTQIVQMDSSGVLTASNTIGNTLTMPATMAGATNFSGAITMGSTLGVSGLVTASAGLTVATGQALTLSGTATMTAGGLITANAGLTAGSNQNITVSGTGVVKHGTKTRTIAAMTGTVDGSTTTYTIGNAEVRITGTGIVFYLPIAMDAGERVINVRLRVKDSAGTQIDGRIKRGNSDDTVTTLSGPQTSNNTGVYQTLTFSAINSTASSGDFYFATLNLSSGTGAWTILKAEVDYDRP